MRNPHAFPEQCFIYMILPEVQKRKRIVYGIVTNIILHSVEYIISGNCNPLEGTQKACTLFSKLFNSQAEKKRTKTTITNTNFYH